MNVNIPKGLTTGEAEARLLRDGHNELPDAKSRNALVIAWEVVKEPMFLLLVGCGSIYLLLGETSDALMLLAFVVVIIGITFYQERKTERALDALRDLSSPRALVIRDGVERRIAGRDVVADDIIVLAEGDRIPADAALVESSYLSVDESLLTGESVPVRKVPGDGGSTPARPGGDDTPWLFSGTLVVKGRGIARVVSTGARTEMGKIGKALSSVEPDESPLNRQTGRLVRNFALVGFVICVLVIVFYGLSQHDWMRGLLAGITLAMAMIPEEFPVVLSIFLALGAWRIAQKQVLTRRVPAVETLGATTVLCVDKTGTLTQNKMTVSKVLVRAGLFEIPADAAQPLPEETHRVIEFGILASQQDPFDPMEKAFRELGSQRLAETEHIHTDWLLEREYPLSDALLAMSHVWRSSESGMRVVAAKGAPEAVADLCHLPQDELARVAAGVDTLASEGLRVLAVARGDASGAEFPESQHDFTFQFLGLVGFSDPVRPAVPDAVAECRGAGIRVAMITGDYPSTARNIARQIGMDGAETCVTGQELDAMDDAALAEKARSNTIFARVVPEQKLRIVKAFKANGGVAAMTGDGVNDAPALKAADIGIAMGGRGTDVAREAASLVLLDDDFSSIVTAVRMGRRIFDNIRKAIAFILAVHVPIAGLSLLPVLFKWPLMLLPVHIVFLEMVIDPACSVVFEMEPEEDGIMRRKPRHPQAPILTRNALWQSLIQGVGVLCVVFAVYAWMRGGAYSENDTRTVAFTVLLLGNLALIVNNRSWSHGFLDILRIRNKAMWWVIGGALGFLALVVYTPPLQSVFHLSPLHGKDLSLILLAVTVIILLLETVKRVSWLLPKQGEA